MRQEPSTGLRRLQPIEKAARLLAEGRVRLVASDQVYIVDGEHDTYYVSAGPDGIRCPCKASTPLCSHVLAVAQLRTKAHLGEVA